MQSRRGLLCGPSEKALWVENVVTYTDITVVFMGFALRQCRGPELPRGISQQTDVKSVV